MTLKVSPHVRNFELRRALDRATKLRSVSLYRAEIERLRQVYGHTVTVLPHDFGPYNRGEPEPSCYGLALGLADNPDYLRLVATAAKLTQEQPLTSEVVTRLVKNRVLRPRKKSKLGDVILYSSEVGIRHAGILMSEDRVRSKWGSDEVHEHGLWEVPIGYGDTAKFYLPPDHAQILSILTA